MIRLLKDLFSSDRLEPSVGETLRTALRLLPQDYETYLHQLEEGLIGRVAQTDLDHPLFANYVFFQYRPEISRRFFDRKGRFSRIRNVRVSNRERTIETLMSIYFDHGLLCGYAFDAGTEFVPDPSSVDVSMTTFQLLDQSDSHVVSLMSPAEKTLINWSDVFEVELGGKTYYHLRGIGDGDFIGIDEGRNIYEIRHDPFEIKPLTGTLTEVLARYKAGE